MNTTISKLKQIAPIVFVGLMILQIGCKKDGEVDTTEDGNVINTSTIKATNVINSSTKITTVKAEVYWESSDGEDYGYDAITQAQYQNNGFTLELPASVPAKYLYLLSEDVPDGIVISDKTAKVTAFSIEAYDKDENNIGCFYLTEDASDEAGADWIYVDKNVNITGGYKDVDNSYNEEYNYDYNVKLKKGWNTVYGRMTKSHSSSTGRDVYSYTFTNQKPSGVNYYWYFESYNYSSSSVKAAIKSVAKKKLFLQNNNE